MTDRIEATLYRGETEGQNEGGLWYSTDRDHAAAFGDVSEYAARAKEGRIHRCHADDIIRFREEETDQHGPMMVDQEVDLLEQYGDEAVDGFIDLIVIEGWEGDGLCIYDYGRIVEPAE